MRGGVISATPNQPMNLLGIPYDRPVVGYGGKTINTLRLWGAASPDYFDFGEFSSGDFFGAVFDKVAAESLTRVLYPDDSTTRGRSLRFVQEYFLVGCSLADIVARFRRRGNDWNALPDKVAIQLNDTHPAMAVAELMRILLDQARAGLGHRLGPDRPHARPTPTTRCCPRRWRNGRSNCSSASCRASSKSSTRSMRASWAT